MKPWSKRFPELSLWQHEMERDYLVVVFCCCLVASRMFREQQSHKMTPLRSGASASCFDSTVPQFIGRPEVSYVNNGTGGNKKMCCWWRWVKSAQTWSHPTSSHLHCRKTKHRWLLGKVSLFVCGTAKFFFLYFQLCHLILQNMGWVSTQPFQSCAVSPGGNLLWRNIVHPSVM